MRFRLKPTYIVERVTDINIEDLKAENIKGIMFDLDNTLMHPKTYFYPEDVSTWIEKIKSDFKIVILSNNHDKSSVEKAGETVGCPAFEEAKKPSIKVALKALKEMELLPSEVVMVGDRPLTDIWVGERLGFTTILVDPLRKKDEHPFIKCLRRLERVSVTVPHKIFSHLKK